MTKGKREFLTGFAIGAAIGLLAFGKIAFGAEISPEDAELIAKTVQLEAGNQSFEGRRLVAATILNRTEHSEFPDDVSDVLSQENQFATYKKLDSAESTWQDKLAVQMEVENRSNDEVLFFRTGHYGTGTPLMKVGDHYFSTIKEPQTLQR